MDSILLVINNSLPLFLTIGIVLFLRYKKVIPANAKDILNPIIFKLVIPFFAFRILLNINFSSEDLAVLLLVGVFNLVLIAIFFLVGKASKLNSKSLGALALASFGYSIGPMYPFFQFNFNSEVFGKIVIIDVLLFLMTMILSPIIGSILNKESRLNVKSVTKTILSDVVLWTVLITILLKAFNVSIPVQIINTADFIGGSFSLLVAVLLAMTLKLPDMKRIKLLVLSTVGRYLLITLIVFVIVLLLSPANAMVKALILALATPFSSYPLLYTERYNLDSELITQLTLFSRLVAFVTFPILIAILLNY